MSASKQKTLKVILTKISIFIIACCTIAFFIGFLLFATNLPLEKQVPVLSETNFDGAAVFTGGKYRLGTISLIIKNGFKGPVLISGVFPGSKLETIFNSFDLTEQQKQQVQFDYNAISTAGNVKQTLEWIKSNNLNNVLVITSYYHIPRTKLLLDRYTDANVNIIAYPVFSNTTSVSILFSEYVKYLLFNFKIIYEFSIKSQLPY